MLRGLIIALSVLALANVYVDHGLVSRWPAADSHLLLVWLTGIVLFITQLSGPFGDRLGFSRWRHGRFGVLVAAVDWLSYFILGVMSCLMIYVLVADLVSTAWQLIAPPADPGKFNIAILYILAGVTVVTSALGVWQARQTPRIRRVDVPLSHLPHAFDGFTIVQISDLHLGPTIGRAFAARVAALAQSLNPDLIALTGDFGDGRAADLAGDLGPIGTLHAPHGVYYITGNHEYYWHAEEWLAAFRQLGATVLTNSHVLLERGAEKILLAGVTDYSSIHMAPATASDPAKALAGAPPGLTRILLAHQPVSYKKAAEAGYHLQLSGHTHGGQYFPFNLLIPLFQRYYRGLNRHESMWVYVSTGTGYWGPPLRTLVPPEIALLTLRRA